MFFPVFLSIVCVARNQSANLERTVAEMSKLVSALVSDYEIIIVDNASDDDSIAKLRELTAETGLPNIQVFALTREVDANTASWVGIENALGDFVGVIDPQIDDISFLPSMLDHAASGADVVFASNDQKPARTSAYHIAFIVFNALYRWFSGIDLAKEAPQYRVLSKRVVNFILQHPQPALAYRHLPARGGFTRANLHYSATPRSSRGKHISHGVEQAMRLMVATTRAPLRLVTSLSLFGAIANLVYSAYVVAIALLKEDVAPGWVSLSLQQSGMFLLISLVLLVLGEYILQMASLSSEGPLYHIGQEFTSALMSRRDKLNVEEGNSFATSDDRTEV